MKCVNLFKRWEIALVIIITKLLTFHVAFASMGSTGGGGAVHLAVVEAHQAAAVI